MAVTYFGSSNESGGSSGIGSNSLRGSSFAAPVTGNIITARGNMAANGASPCGVKVAIYASSAGVPGARLGYSDLVTIPASDPVSLRTFTFSTPVAVVSGTSYFLCLLVETSPGLAFRWNGGGSGTIHFVSSPGWPTPPNPFGAAGSFGGIYALEAGIDDGAGGAVFVPRIIAVT